MPFYLFNVDCQTDEDANIRDTDGRAYGYTGILGCVQTKWISNLEKKLTKPADGGDGEEDDSCWAPPGHLIAFPEPFTCTMVDELCVSFGTDRVVFNLRGCNCEPRCEGDEDCEKRECDNCGEIGCNGVDCLKDERDYERRRRRRERLKLNGFPEVVEVPPACAALCTCGNTHVQEAAERNPNPKKKQRLETEEAESGSDSSEAEAEESESEAEEVE